MEETLRERLEKEADGGALPCALACRIAEELGVSEKEVGRAADEAGIKITECRLGCF
jgi:hypothetical protein